MAQYFLGVDGGQSSTTALVADETGQVLGMGRVLELAPLVAKENDRHLLGFALSFAGTPGGDLLPEALRPKHEAWVQGLFGARLDALGYAPKPGEDEDTRLLRPQLIGTLGWTGRDPKVLSTARSLTERWLTEKQAIHPDVLDVVLALGGEGGDGALHEKLLAAAKRERDRAERNRLLGALSEASDRAVVERQLPLVLGDDFEMREAMRLVWGAANDYRTRDLALRFVEQHWDAIVAKLPKDGGASLVWLAAGVCTAPERDAARTFFDGRSTKYLGGPRTFALAMENIDLCVAFRERHRASAIAFFEKRK